MNSSGNDIQKQSLNQQQQQDVNQMLIPEEQKHVDDHHHHQHIRQQRVSLVIDNKESIIDDDDDEEDDSDISLSDSSSSGEEEDDDEEENVNSDQNNIANFTVAETSALPIRESKMVTKPRSNSNINEYSASPKAALVKSNIYGSDNDSDMDNNNLENDTDEDFKIRREMRSSTCEATSTWTKGKITTTPLSNRINNSTLVKNGEGRLFTGTSSRGGLAHSKKFVSPTFYSSSVLVPVDKSSNFSLSIASTETVVSNKKSYTVYVINIKSNDIVWTIVRRYKHVRAFALKIQNEVPSLSSFEFPSKKIIGNMNPQFIKQRCNQLQSFFNAICESNLAKQSRNLKVFLDPNFSPSLKAITNPSKEGYLYLLIHKVSLSRKKRKWKKVYCCVVNSNLFFWKTRDQYAEAKGVINLRHATAKITHTLDKLCIEVKIIDIDSGSIHRNKQYKSSVSSNSLALSCTGPREEDHDEEKYFLCAESESRLVQWLDVINKEINTAKVSTTAGALYPQRATTAIAVLGAANVNGGVVPQTPTSTTIAATPSSSLAISGSSIIGSNIPVPPPAPLSLSRSVLSKSSRVGAVTNPLSKSTAGMDNSNNDSNNNNNIRTTTTITTNPLSMKKRPESITTTSIQDESSYRVYIHNQEWSIENVEKGKGKPNKETINLLEATLSYKSVINHESIQKHLNISQNNIDINDNNNNINNSNNNNNNNSTLNNSTTQFIMATPSTSSVHPSFSPIAMGVSKIPNSLSSSMSNTIPKHLMEKLKSKSNNEIVLLPSETIVFYSESIIHIHGNSGTIGRITLTNYRLYFAPYYGSKMSKKCETEGISVPLGMIEDIVKCTGFTPDKLKYYAFEIKCKDFHRIRFMHLPGSSQQKANSRLYEIFEPLIFASDYSKLFCFASYSSSIDPSKGWNLYNPTEEYQRMGIPNESWRVSTFNSDYFYSPTYPSTMVVPKRISDLELINITSFRSKGRIPVMVWKHPKEYAVIARSSQPVVGVTGKRCLEDEKLIENIRLANLESERVYIMDARPQINAVANQVMGMGYEGTKSTYSNCVLKFLNIENIHKMREAQKKLFKTAMYEKEYDRYQSKLEKATNLWLEHIRTILCGTIEVVDTIRYLKSSVVVHCSDGWDRTSQLCALAELILDPYYRTIIGFQKLIEKEWLSFGHKFESRIGQGSRVEKAIEHSPIFLQFIDCVYQILQQNHQRFEFNQQYLMEIMHHLYSCRFGTFLYDNERERVTNELSQKTNSLWSYLNSHTSQWRNSNYQPNTEILSVDTMNLQLWSYYIYWRNFHGFL